MKKMLSGLVVAAFALVAVAPISAMAAPRAKGTSSIEPAQATTTEKKAPAKKQAAKKAPAKKQTAKKAPAKKATPAA